jgi:inorganic triphosphatase YgiF
VTEFELKFQVDPHQRAAVEAAVSRGRSHVSHLRARYFDTADGALAAQHLVIRLRKEGRTWWQTAKAPTDAVLQRHEHNVELPPLAAREQPQLKLERHGGTPVGDLITQALRKAGDDPATAELVAIYGTNVKRTTREMRTGDALVELAFDHGDVRAEDHSRPLCELEIELKSGSAHSMLELARRWRNRYGLWLDAVSKSERGQRLAEGHIHGAPVKAVPPAFPEDNPDGPEIVRATVRACLAQILPNASEVAAGSSDPEHVHQLRVGIRRLRTALREMALFAPAIDPTWEPTLASTFHALGLRRDRDHLEHEIQPRLEAAGAPPVDWPDSIAELPDPADVVRGAEFQTVLIDLIAISLPGDAAGEAPDETPAAAKVPWRKHLRKRLSELHQEVVRDGRRFESLEPAAQHRVRKRLKRLRYLGEFVAPLFDAQEARRFLKELEPAQDALGRHNDNAMAIAAYRENAGHDGRSWFAVGWLGAQQPASATDCRKALDKAADARPFWKT